MEIHYCLKEFEAVHFLLGLERRSPTSDPTHEDWVRNRDARRLLICPEFPRDRLIAVDCQAPNRASILGPQGIWILLYLFDLFFFF